MADEIPMIPKAGTLMVHSGNIINWNRLKRKPNQTPTEEVSECISSTLNTYLSAANKTELQYLTDLDCVHSKFKEALPEEDRGDLKVTVKIFLCSLVHPGCIKEVVEKALVELNVEFVETALLAFPELEPCEELSLEMIQPYWKELEELIESGTVLSLGFADLDKTLLEQVWDWAKVKPVVNQVNLDSCCVMPKDLVEFAKEHDIQLLTHNDPKKLLPANRLQAVIQMNSTEKDSENWEPLWVCRYSVLIKCRGIIKSKGYLLKAFRDVKKRK